MTKKSTKDQILLLLKKEDSLTVNDLIERLAITHMAIRKHLTTLEKDGLIFSTEVKQPIGRPIQAYSLSTKAENHFPKNYHTMSVELLHDIKDVYGEEAINELFYKRENRLLQEYTTRLQSKVTFADKVNEVVTIQNEKGYMADLSQIDENTYELIEYNCPILAVAHEFKVACKCETDLLNKVLGTKQINRTCCRTDGDNHCKFLLTF